MSVALWVTAAVVVVSVVAGYLNWIAGRHERLAARADAAWAALDAQLVRRAAPARSLALLRGDTELATAAERALAGGKGAREDAENALGRALRRGGYGELELDVAPGPQPAAAAAAALADLREAAARVQLARQFHNDAVRDLRAIRRRWAARAMRLGRGDQHGPGRGFFEIDDTVAAATSETVAAATSETVAAATSESHQDDTVALG